MIRRLLPYPLLSLTVALVWMMLVNRFAWGSLVFAAMLGIAIPLLTARWWPGRPRMRRPAVIARFAGIVLIDIVKANIEVARIILFMPRTDLRPTWIAVPLDVTHPEAILLLASTVTLTPGTVSADLSADGRSLLVHCLHAPDPDAVVADIKSRYESPLKEIFE